MDLLIQKSTKKILNLVKNLPDREKLEASLRDTKSPSSQKKRFTKHPRSFHASDHTDLCDEDPTTSTNCQESLDEPPNTNSITINQTLTEHPSDSSDEYCDVTIRTDIPESSATQWKTGSGDNTISQQLPSTKSFGVTKSAETRTKASQSSKGAHQSKTANERRSDTETSTISERKELKIIVEPRLKVLWERSVKLLKDCRLIFDSGIDPPDGYEDLERRKKRNFEFSSRFARIYLYQSNCLLIDIENIVRPPSGKRPKTVSSVSLGQKFYAAYQTIYLALEAYHKHLPTGLVNGMPDKFRELLELVLKLSDMYHDVCDNLPEEDNIIDVFDIHCNSMLIDDSLAPQASAKYNSNLCPSKFRLPTPTPESRLSMYSVPVRKDVYWKNAVAALAKKKYQVASKYKTATFKHRPPPSQEPEPKPSKPVAKVGKKATTSKTGSGEKKKLKASSFTIMDIDNNVTTYVQQTEMSDMHHSTLVNVIDGKTLPKNTGILHQHAEGFYQKVSKGQQRMNRIEYECILDHFVEIVGEAKLPSTKSKEAKIQFLLEMKFGKPIQSMDFQEFVGHLVSYANSRNNANANAGSVMPGATLDGNPDLDNSKSKTISVTGASNAQLICTKDNTQSLSDISSDQPSQIQTLDPEGHLRRKLSELTISPRPNSKELIYKERDDCDEVELALAVKRSQGAIPRSYKKKGGKHTSFAGVTTIPPKAVEMIPLKMLPKKTILNVIEYKLQYHKQAKNNYMYKKSGDIQPWLLVQRVADNLLEEVLLSVARDIQVEQILKKIYAEEFK